MDNIIYLNKVEVNRAIATGTNLAVKPEQKLAVQNLAKTSIITFPKTEAPAENVTLAPEVTNEVPAPSVEQPQSVPEGQAPTNAEPTATDVVTPPVAEAPTEGVASTPEVTNEIPVTPVEPAQTPDAVAPAMEMPSVPTPEEAPTTVNEIPTPVTSEAPVMDVPTAMPEPTAEVPTTPVMDIPTAPVAETPTESVASTPEVTNEIPVTPVPQSEPEGQAPTNVEPVINEEQSGVEVVENEESITAKLEKELQTIDDEIDAKIVELNEERKRRHQEVVQKYGAEIEEAKKNIIDFKSRAEEHLKNAQAAEQIAMMAKQNAEAISQNPVMDLPTPPTDAPVIETPSNEMTLNLTKEAQAA